MATARPIPEHYGSGVLRSRRAIVALRSRNTYRADAIATRRVHLFGDRMNTWLALGVVDDVTMVHITEQLAGIRSSVDSGPVSIRL